MPIANVPLQVRRLREEVAELRRRLQTATAERSQAPLSVGNPVEVRSKIRGHKRRSWPMLLTLSGRSASSSSSACTSGSCRHHTRACTHSGC